MTPLIDGDLLLHEIGWSCEFKDQDTGEPVLMSWDFCQDLLDKKIQLICEDVGATTPPILFLSDSEWINNQINRRRKLAGEEPREFVKGIRYGFAKTKPYKGTRNNPKPYHFYNIITYLMSEYDTCISEEGLEADDMMCIEQSKRDDTIICSRDKDLRICEGWHYSWECGGQRAIGPDKTDRVGWLVCDDHLLPSGKVKKKYYGYGLKFFFFQMICGDTADNIPGLPKKGAAAAYKLLDPMEKPSEMFAAVQALYKEVMGDKAKEYFFEQANLLWMRTEKGQDFVTNLVRKD